MVQIIPRHKKGPSTSQQFGEAFSRAAVAGSQYLYEKEQKEKQQENISNFLKDQYGIENAKDVPAEFQMQALKGAQSKAQQLVGKKTPEQELKHNELFSRALNNQASPEELASLSPKEQIDLDKAKRDREKEPTKGISEKPIEPDQLDKMQKVRDNPRYEKAKPTEKYRMLTDAGVSRPNAKAEVDIELEQYKGSKEDEERAKKLQYDYHKESKDYDEDLRNRYTAAKREYATIKHLEGKVGNVTPKSMYNVMKSFGKTGERLADAFMSGDEAAIQAAIPEFLEGKKEIFGVRLTDADVKIVEDKIVNSRKSPEANRALLKIAKKYAEQSILKGKIARQVKQENGNLRPLGYDDIVEERFEKMVEPVMMVTDRGQEIEVPAYQVSGAINHGWTIAK